METSPANEAGQREAKLYAIVGRKDFRIDELEAENVTLREQLDALLKQQNGTQDRLHATLQTFCPRSAELDRGARNVAVESDYEVLSRQHEALDWRFKSLEALHRECERKINALEAKCKDYKDKARRWYDYVERQKKDGRILRPSTSSSPKGVRPVNGPSTAAEAQSRDADSTPRATVNIAPKLAVGEVHHDYKRSSASPAICSSPPPIQSSVWTEVAGQTRVPQLHVTSSQTTVEDTQPPADLSKEIANSSGDEPELVSERCLKRKAPRRTPRQSPARRIKAEPHSSNGPVEVSSGPMDEPRQDKVPQLRAMYSDLGHTGPPEIVQRSVRRVGDMRRRAVSEEHAKPTPQLQRSASSRSDGDPVSASSSAQYGTNKSDTGGIPRITGPAGRDVLKPLSANVPHSKQTPRKLTPNPGHTTVRGKAGILSEDGDYSSQVNGSPKDVEVPSLRQDATLDALLMGQSTDSTPNVLRRTLRSSPRDHVRTPAQLHTPTSALRIKSPDKCLAANKVPRGIEEPPPSPGPEEEPLRLRDVRTLKLDDFKINPKYLGSKFAFADTLRGRDERRALHTCTKPECCGGALQRVILMGGQKVSGKSDAQVLGDYLGPQFRQILSSYGATKQKEAVLQAHAEAFAKQHGKHRQAFERQSTPPGFWRTDFATTQENLEDRQKAREIERQEVEARYLEAMRAGGQWTFRDE